MYRALLCIYRESSQFSHKNCELAENELRANSEREQESSLKVAEKYGRVLRGLGEEAGVSSCT